eukprot:CAMPEP_0171325856 /NCGR_PEP_ID=MMETSP0816-20121228/117076_1 /TAXON_ID=420281 /ORGANISM="Proboscia inermis, Strain CCAP1064/1" /LENGTH=88 /DNA_ID=CAMNT_0011825151 /DNA_START=635 /DNA_END=901 /DNA_ORIENTATION=-
MYFIGKKTLNEVVFWVFGEIVEGGASIIQLRNTTTVLGAEGWDGYLGNSDKSVDDPNAKQTTDEGEEDAKDLVRDHHPLPPVKPTTLP